MDESKLTLEEILQQRIEEYPVLIYRQEFHDIIVEEGNTLSVSFTIELK